jgi:transketolase
MRKQLITSVENLLANEKNSVLLLGDIGVFGFRNSFKNYPDRVYNIGILEQSIIGVAAGLSISGMIPIVHTIAPFLVERALEQLKIDFGYQELNGNFISIGASYDYAPLGSTHQCPADIMVMLSIPNMQIVTPGTSKEFNSLFSQSYNNGHPTYFRLSEYENENSCDVVFGNGNIIKKGKRATIICVGNMLKDVLDATKDMDVTILYYTTINPFDASLLLSNFNENIIVCEPFYQGSINYKINKALEGKKYSLTNIGIPHAFLRKYGSKQEQDEYLQLDAEEIKNKIKKCIY